MNKSYFTCIECGSQSKIKSRKSNKFCSISCYRVHQRNGNYARGSSRKHSCSECGSDVIGKSKKRNKDGSLSDKIFCDRNCYDSFRSKNRKMERCKCLSCNKSLTNENSNSNQIYCSIECRNEHKKSKDRNCISCGVWFSSLGSEVDCY